MNSYELGVRQAQDDLERYERAVTAEKQRVKQLNSHTPGKDASEVLDNIVYAELFDNLASGLDEIYKEQQQEST